MSDSAPAVEHDARKRKRDELEHEADASEAFRGLPNLLVVEHILRTLTIPEISHGSER
tara:strand:+ start:332 stop:505 length:174 start_codon:yes stop_codon:yes gene_type:complete